MAENTLGKLGTNAPCRVRNGWRVLWWSSGYEGETDMGDKGKRDKGKREQQKKAQLSPKEKRKMKKEKKK